MSTPLVKAARAALLKIQRFALIDPPHMATLANIAMAADEGITALAAAEAQPASDTTSELVERLEDWASAMYEVQPAEVPKIQDDCKLAAAEIQGLQESLGQLRAENVRLQAQPVGEPVAQERARLLASLEEPDDELLAEFQRAFVQQLHRRRHKSGLESAELAGIRALLKMAISRERTAPPAQPAAQPLTDVELEDILGFANDGSVSAMHYYRIARQVERAHNIGSKP